jgi:hypothetical protein
MAKATAARGKARSRSAKARGTGRSAGTGGTKRGKPTSPKKGSGPAAKRSASSKGRPRPGGKGGAAGAAASGKVMSRRPQDKASRVARDSRTGAPNAGGGSDQSAPTRSPGVGLEVEPRTQSGGAASQSQDWAGESRQVDRPVEGPGGDESGYPG